jgi:hypothetical protein
MKQVHKHDELFIVFVGSMKEYELVVYLGDGGGNTW